MKRDRQSNLQQQLEDLRQGLRTVPDLLAIRYSDADSNVVINATQVSASYMPYSRAYKWLLERHEALPHEFAMWVWLGTSLGGLDAFTNPGDVGGPQRFRIGYWEDMQLDKIPAEIEITRQLAQSRISKSDEPSLNSDFKQGESNHA